MIRPKDTKPLWKRMDEVQFLLMGAYFNGQIIDIYEKIEAIYIDEHSLKVYKREYFYLIKILDDRFPEVHNMLIPKVRESDIMPF